MPGGKRRKLAKRLFCTVEMDGSVEDLVLLGDVDDASMLYTLLLRFYRDKIYTAMGPVLLAINPYKVVDQCKPDALAALSALPAEEAPPHVFRVASAAYANLVEHGVPQA